MFVFQLVFFLYHISYLDGAKPNNEIILTALFQNGFNSHLVANRFGNRPNEHKLHKNDHQTGCGDRRMTIKTWFGVFVPVWLRS